MLYILFAVLCLIGSIVIVFLHNRGYLEKLGDEYSTLIAFVLFGVFIFLCVMGIIDIMITLLECIM